ncbi:hypothetical protein FRACYDRAFT_194561 [Fragilariopsis cylindrus CCMP1102]|uniref:Uncharacterized protein n=1 Tax=Fragilariopsis cylindrus CCMP1102 TaxID=635003 RepID=A0A1E7EVG3_9STRA|nr:hypothetical protein FRACYDRAFT_194561 [Fragilariopsis cylindrus CCMP1102]|eukprot:OEU09882.1 hypothetical protein FRACYDRAFT_194561 [Fragilariopsis cylindrus CCMP1102]
MTGIGFFAAAVQMTMTMTSTAVIAFTPVVHTRHHQRNSNTRIFLEDWVADMIDGEKYRQEHHEEYEEKWMKKNKAAVLSRIDVDGAVGYPSQMMGESDREAMAEHRRDEKMAFTKPEKYCADRCVATGNCDILEDFYELGPEDVIAFCKECVLNNNDETIEDGAGCVIPEAFYDKEPPLFRP